MFRNQMKKIETIETNAQRFHVAGGTHRQTNSLIFILFKCIENKHFFEKKKSILFTFKKSNLGPKFIQSRLCLFMLIFNFHRKEKRKNKSQLLSNHIYQYHSIKYIICITFRFIIYFKLVYRIQNTLHAHNCHSLVLFIGKRKEKNKTINNN